VLTDCKEDSQTDDEIECDEPRKTIADRVKQTLTIDVGDQDGDAREEDEYGSRQNEKGQRDSFQL
jgi:hypothetical protein